MKKALPSHLSEQANEALKSEYNLDFLGIAKPVHERELENRAYRKHKRFIAGTLDMASPLSAINIELLSTKKSILLTFCFIIDF